MSCFPIGKMKGLTYSQLLKYSYAVATFKRVEAYNLAVAAKRSEGDSTQSYYKFVDQTEEAIYTEGLFLLVQNDPAYANYVPVKKI
jgi:hypothetical protein